MERYNLRANSLLENRFLGEMTMAGSFKLLGPAVFALGLFPLSPVAAMAPVPAKSPAGPVITGVELDPAVIQLQQLCPAVLVFHGHITTTRPASVTYTWLDSRGRTWPEHHRRFSLSGVNGVSHKWKLGKPGRTVDEWVQLKIISPEQKLSNKVPVRFTCVK
jgi:hypothetical protein